jgi:Arc/MetJ-type ribon-helix-helix transcriptional regulator
MSDTEKITINMSVVDLGKIDLLVQEGLYSNRTDFIRTAIRSQTATHALELNQSVTRNNFGIGIFHYSKKGLEKKAAAGERLNLSVVGLLSFANDVPAELVDQVVESTRVAGVVRAPEAVKAVLSAKA